jgi:hypothetical protein
LLAAAVLVALSVTIRSIQRTIETTDEPRIAVA